MISALQKRACLIAVLLVLLISPGNTDSDEVIINVVKDSGVWLEAECGAVGSLWETEQKSL